MSNNSIHEYTGDLFELLKTRQLYKQQGIGAFELSRGFYPVVSRYLTVESFDRLVCKALGDFFGDFVFEDVHLPAFHCFVDIALDKLWLKYFSIAMNEKVTEQIFYEAFRKQFGFSAFFVQSTIRRIYSNICTSLGYNNLQSLDRTEIKKLLLLIANRTIDIESIVPPLLIHVSLRFVTNF